MEESSGNTFANRDSPIPVVRFSNYNNDASSEYSQDKENPTDTIDSSGKEQSRRWRFGQKAKDIIGSSKAMEGEGEKEKSKSMSMQDRLLER